MSDWDKMDREVWSKSEVMQELEKKIAHATVTLSEKYRKQANLSQLPQDLEKVNQQAGPAAESIGKVEKAVSNLYSNVDDEETSEEKKEEEREEDLLECLEELSRLLADEGDIELAYKVERLIREIESGVDFE